MSKLWWVEIEGIRKRYCSQVPWWAPGAPSDSNYVTLDGASYFTIDDHADFAGGTNSGDRFCVDVCCEPSETDSGPYILAAQTSGTISWSLSFSDDTYTAKISKDGGAVNVTTVSTVFTGSGKRIVRLYYVHAGDGSSDLTCEIISSAGTDTNHTHLAVAPIYDGTVDVTIGASATGLSLFKGKIYWAAINSYTGTTYCYYQPPLANLWDGTEDWSSYNPVLYADFFGYRTGDTTYRAQSHMRTGTWVEPVTRDMDVVGYPTRSGTYPTSDPGLGVRYMVPLISAIPDVQGPRCEPLDGSATPGEFEVELVDDSDEITDLVSVNNLGTTQTVARGDVVVLYELLKIEDSPQHYGVFEVPNDMDTYGYPFTVPCYFYIGRETLYAFDNGSGITYSVERGKFGSRPGTGDLITERPPFLYTREVKLYQCDDTDHESDAICFRGYLDAISEDRGVYRFHCSSLMRQLDADIGAGCAKTQLCIAVTDGAPKPAYGCTDWALVCEIDSCGDFHGYGGAAENGYVKVDNEIIKYEKCGNSVIHDIEDDHYGCLALCADLYDGSENETHLEGHENGVTHGRGIFSEYATPSTKLVNSTNADEQELPNEVPIFMTGHSAGAEVQELVHWEAFTLDPAGSVPSDPACAVRAESVILNLLTSTGYGTNGTYDVLPLGWGIGIPQERVDITGIENACKDPAIAAINFRDFVIVPPTSCRDWLEKNILRPCHLFFCESTSGQITVKRLYSRSEAVKSEALGVITVQSIGMDDLLDIPTFMPGKPPIGTVDVRVNYHPGDGKYYGLIHCVLNEDTRDWYQGLTRNFEIEVHTIHDSVIGSGVLTVTRNSNNALPGWLSGYIGTIWERFAVKPCPVIELTVPYTQWANVQIGQVIKLTCSVTPNPSTGTRGMTNEYFQIVEASPEIGDNAIKVVAWYCGPSTLDRRLLAPVAYIVSYSAGDGDCADPHVHITGATLANGTAYTSTVNAFEVGDKVMLMTAAYEAIEGDATPEILTIKAIDTATPYISFTGAPGHAPTLGEYVCTAPYNECTASQRAAWAFGADAYAKLDQDADPDDQDEAVLRDR